MPKHNTKLTKLNTNQIAQIERDLANAEAIVKAHKIALANGDYKGLPREVSEAQDDIAFFRLSLRLGYSANDLPALQEKVFEAKVKAFIKAQAKANALLNELNAIALKEESFLGGDLEICCGSIARSIEVNLIKGSPHYKVAIDDLIEEGKIALDNSGYWL